MSQIIGKWGSNLAVRIPRNISFLRKGSLVDFVETEEGLLIKPAKRRRSMAELLAGEDGSFKSELVDFGPAQGGEFDL
jgi:antitoxin MazE